jgi:SAM-dependent methyltransferase
MMGQVYEKWFEEESFWLETYPFMFPEARFISASESIPTLASLAKIECGSVLDLACGPGRFAIPFAKAGYAVTGVDRSGFLLKKANELAESNRVTVEWVESDMCEFVRPNAFDLAINLFTSFGYFDEAADNRSVLENVYSSLKNGGTFILDILGKEILASRFQPTLSESLPDGRILVQRVSIVDDWSRVEGEWTLIKGSHATTFRNRHWVYSGQEIRDLLASVGFAEISLYGSLEKTPYGPQAQRLVAVSKKA